MRPLVRLVALAAASAGALCFAACSTSSGAATRACDSHLGFGPLPTWARRGFTPPDQRFPHVVGRSRQIVAVLFGYPLESPPRRRTRNKILWVPRVPVRAAAPLRISARRVVDGALVGRAVVRTVPRGPGPSFVDVPAAGCWRLALSWGGRRDSLDVVYRRRRRN